MVQLVFIFLFFSVIAFGQTASRQIEPEKMIGALLTTKDLTITYNDDGAADATVTEKPIAVVRQILNLKAKAIPLLINHLDDQRLTTAKFKNRPVSVGYICLDILTNITQGKTVHIENCFDDGLGACLDPDYYYRPDITKQTVMKKVKTAWERAYQARKIKYQSPAWLK